MPSSWTDRRKILFRPISVLIDSENWAGRTPKVYNQSTARSLVKGMAKDRIFQANGEGPASRDSNWMVRRSIFFREFKPFVCFGLVAKPASFKPPTSHPLNIDPSCSWRDRDIWHAKLAAKVHWEANRIGWSAEAFCSKVYVVFLVFILKMATVGRPPNKSYNHKKRSGSFLLMKGIAGDTTL